MDAFAYILGSHDKQDYVRLLSKGSLDNNFVCLLQFYHSSAGLCRI